MLRIFYFLANSAQAVVFLFFGLLRNDKIALKKKLWIFAGRMTRYSSGQTGVRFSLKAVMPSIASGQVAWEAIISLARW